METYKRGLGVHAWRSQKASPELTLKTTWKQAKQRLVACPSGEQGDSLSREALRPAVSADPPMASSHRSVSVRECVYAGACTCVFVRVSDCVCVVQEPREASVSPNPPCGFFGNRRNGGLPTAS